MSSIAPLEAPPRLNDDEIDLRQVAAALGRQKFIIGGITIAATVLSGIYAFTRKPVWEGSFQIVLENQDAGAGRLARSASQNSNLSSLLGLAGGAGTSSLSTEVEILNSPSILKPVTDFIMFSKADARKDISEWIFKSNFEPLEIELVKGTTILEIVYRDTDKNLILPVLNKILDVYQEYSGRDRQRGLSQGLNYLEQQLTKLQLQSDRSMRVAQAYALANGLGIQDGMPTEAASTATSVEGSRETAQNNVNALRQQIAAAQSAGGARLYKAPQLQANSALYGQLQTVEAELKQKSALLTPRDQSIQALLRQRASLTAYINQQTIGLLQGELLTAEAKLASLTRPRDVVLKHRELVRTALRDEKLLTDIETQLQDIRLDQARQVDPWELISTPTVLGSPVVPNKKRIVAIGLLGGLVLGCGAGLFRDHSSGLVFSENELKALLPCPLLERLPDAAPEQWTNTAQLLVQGPLADAESVALLPVGNLPAEQVKQFSQALNNALGHKQLLIGSDLLAIRSCSTQLLVTALGATQRQQLQQLRKQLALQGTPLAGWLLIDPELEA